MEKLNFVITRATPESIAAFTEERTRELPHKCLPEPIVSVCLITYNHENLIAQALDSVLMQDTDFLFELVVGEDCSKDKTRSIVLHYKSRYPDRIRVLLSTENLGQYTGNGRLNFLRNLKACRGKYIALLEGDDYWTHPRKLQKQVDFLEANPGFVICCHNTKKLFEKEPSRVAYMRPDHSSQTKDVLTIEDQIRDVYSYHTSSVVFRNGLLRLPEFFKSVESGDIAFFTMLAQFGKIKYLDDVMSVWRRHSQGISRSHNGPALYAGRIRMNSYLDEYFNGRFTHLYQEINDNLYMNLFHAYAHSRPNSRFLKYIVEYLCRRNASSGGLVSRLFKVTRVLGVSLCHISKRTLRSVFIITHILFDFLRISSLK